MRGMLILICFASFAATCVIALSGPGVRFGLWDYGTGLAVFRGMKTPAIILAVLAIGSTLLSWRLHSDLTLVLLISAISVACAAFAPVRFEQLVAQTPLIHDITTDFENPPAIVAAADEPRKNPVDYVGTEKAPQSEKTIAETQREAFPEVRSLVVNANMAQVETIAREAIVDMGMQTIASGSEGGVTTLEATYTSFWFGFTDDFIVRLEPDAEGIRVDLRSKSRVGLSDLGANAKRVLEFTSKIKAKL